MWQSSGGRRLGEAVDAARTSMLATNAPHARFAALCANLAPVGFDQINYGFFDPVAAHRDKADVLFLSTMPVQWLEHYYSEGLAHSDPHVLKVRDGQLAPYMWGGSAIGALEDPQQRDTAMRVAEAGQRSAICTPFASPFAPLIPVAGMTLGSSLDEDDLLGLIGRESGRLVSLVHLFHQLSLGELHRQHIGAQPLSARERDCMRYAADGLLQEAIGHKLGLARVTVETHLRNAKRKLKARSLPQAVARAIVFGEIPPA